MELVIADILVREGYIKKYDIVEDGAFQTIRIPKVWRRQEREDHLRYQEDLQAGLTCMLARKICRRYLSGLGIAIVSTNQGIITDKQARHGVGGEVLCLFGNY